MTGKDKVSNHPAVPNTRECAPPMPIGRPVDWLEALAPFYPPPLAARLLNVLRIACSSGDTHLIMLAMEEAQ